MQTTTIFITGWSFSKDFLENYYGQKSTLRQNIVFIDATKILSKFNIEIDKESYFDSITKEIEKLIFNSSSLFNIRIIGWSLGGLIAQIFAAKTMLKVSRLTLINTTANFLRDSDERTQAIDKLISNVTEGLNDTSVRNNIMKKFYASLINEDSVWETNKENASTEKLVEQSAEYSTEELINSLLFLKNITIDETLLNTIDIRCNIVTATNDLLIPPEHAEHLHSAIKNSSISYIENSGHLLPIQNPKILV